MNEVVCGRRRWSLDEKRAVVELSLDPEASVAEVASSFDLLPAQIYGWRRELREAEEEEGSGQAPAFLPAVIEPASLVSIMPGQEMPGEPLLPASMVQMALDVRGVEVAIAHGANADLVTAVIAALKRAG